jgi:hypothetical protein
LGVRIEVVIAAAAADVAADRVAEAAEGAADAGLEVAGDAVGMVEATAVRDTKQIETLKRSARIEQRAATRVAAFLFAKTLLLCG